MRTETNVSIDISKVISDSVAGRKRAATYKWRSMTYPYKRSGAGKLWYARVCDDDAKFISLFGVSVDVNSGDIALGLFPNKYSYVKIGNIREKINDALFGNKSDCGEMIYKLNDEGFRYILEGLKLNPSMLKEQVHENFIELVDMPSVDNEGYKSVLLNLVRDRVRIQEGRIQEYTKDGGWVSSVVQYCVMMRKNMYDLAVDYFNYFICEDTARDKMTGAASLLLSIGNPNVESLILRYVSLGVPIDFLLALKSYGFAAKQFRAFLPERAEAKMIRSLSSIFDKDVEKSINTAEILSSMVYVDKEQSSMDVVKTYNIMDLLRAAGWEDNILFSLEVLKDYKNISLYKGIYKKFDLGDILLECGMSEKDFVTNVGRYTKRFLELRDRGSLYTRDVKFSQYSFLSFSPNELKSCGEVFEKAASMILKKF